MRCFFLFVLFIGTLFNLQVVGQNIDSLYSSSISSSTAQNRIVGEYYVNDFDKLFNEGIELKNETPKYSFSLYKLFFRTDGFISYTDLTESYDCANGVLVNLSGKWRIDNNGQYVISFTGENNGETKFYAEGVYTYAILSNNNVWLELIRLNKF